LRSFKVALVMENRSIEIHDSVLEDLHVLNSVAILDFSSVYIHQSAGRPGVDAGSGWVQKARLQIRDAIIEGSFSDFPCEILGGHITLGEAVLNNEIRIPLGYAGKTELRLESWNGAFVRITGGGVELELIGEPKYVEEFRPNPSN
jgi:hypothetical protein